MVVWLLFYPEWYDGPSFGCPAESRGGGQTPPGGGGGHGGEKHGEY